MSEDLSSPSSTTDAAREFAIEVRGVQKAYGETVALNRTDLVVPTGSFFGLLGPNGAGKSTLIHILAGLIERDDGAVSVLGTSIQRGTYKYKQHVGFVLERPLYIEKLTAAEYLQFAGSMHGLDDDVAKSRSEELIDFLNLTDKRNDWIEAYSKGMKKKVSLAAALIHRPDLLVLDEPFEGVDAPSARAIREVLRRMVARNTTILLTSHVLDVAESLCDHVAVMQDGHIAVQGTMDALLSKASSDGSTYDSLEALFHDVVSPDDPMEQAPSWL